MKFLKRLFSGEEEPAAGGSDPGAPPDSLRSPGTGAETAPSPEAVDATYAQLASLSEGVAAELAAAHRSGGAAADPGTAAQVSRQRANAAAGRILDQATMAIASQLGGPGLAAHQASQTALAQEIATAAAREGLPAPPRA